MLAFFLMVGLRPITSDAHTYWFSVQPGVELYGRLWNVESDAFVYSPVAAVAFGAVAWTSFAVFYAAWTAVLLVSLVWLVGPAWAAVALFVPGFAGAEVAVGNVNLLIAVAVVLGVRGHAIAWLLPLLTKVTPGIGILWNVYRRDWRGLAWTAGIGGVLIIGSHLLLPGAWLEWFGILRQQGPPLPDAFLVVPIYVRMVAAVLIVLLAARRRWPWLVAVAVWLAIPNWSVLPSLTVLLAIPRLMDYSGSRWSMIAMRIKATIVSYSSRSRSAAESAMKALRPS